MKTVINFDTGNSINVLESRLGTNRGNFVKINGSNFWYPVVGGKYISKTKHAKPFIYDKQNNRFYRKPNNNLNRRNVYVSAPPGYAVNTRTRRIYRLENFPANQHKNAGLKVLVERNGPGKPWRLVNKNLANKYNLEMEMMKNMGLWGGMLLVKKN